MNLVTFVIDDDEAARTSLVFMLRAEKIRAHAFSSAQEFIGCLNPDQQGVIVTDVRMPGLDGIGLLSEVRKRSCWWPVIVITGHGDVTLAVEAMKSGASDFIEKPFDSTVILTAIQKSLDTCRAIHAERSRRNFAMERIRSLSERELEIFKKIANGGSNKEIAMIFNISPRTVEIHRANIMLKLGARKVADLVHMSIDGEGGFNRND